MTGPLTGNDSESLAPDPEAGGGWRADPAEWLALINPQGGATDSAVAAVKEGPPTPVASGTNEVAELVEHWVRRVALGGDARRGVARLDIGSGRLAGTELLVTAEPGYVSVELSLPAGLEDAGLGERLRSRLARRGFESEVLVR